MVAAVPKHTLLAFWLAGSYVRFVSEKFRSVQATFPPGTPVPQIIKLLGQMWRGLSAKEKQPYIDATQAERDEHDRVSVCDPNDAQPWIVFSFNLLHSCRQPHVEGRDTFLHYQYPRLFQDQAF